MVLISHARFLFHADAEQALGADSRGAGFFAKLSARAAQAKRSVSATSYARIMQENEYCDEFADAELEDLARRWLADIRGSLSSGESDSGQSVVSMNFSAPPEIQWRFILIAVSLSESDDELSQVAAGPIEHLLGGHGDAYMSLVENEVATNPKFARALTAVWQYMMSAEVWSRVQRLQKGVSDPLH